MRTFILVVLCAMFVLVGIGVYGAWKRSRVVLKELDATRAELMKATTNRDALRAELDYLLNPQNLEKELKARFNFKKPGEKLIILVPERVSSTPTSTSSSRP